MALDNLVGLIEKLRGKIERYEDVLCESEWVTRYVLIDPLLRELGWDCENPEQVRPEYRRKADYALLESGRVIFIIEAKKLKTPLREGISQGIQYCIEEGAPYFTVTDGRRWEIYDSHRTVPLQEKLIRELDICAGTAQEAALNSLFLWRESPGIASAPPRLSLTEATPKQRVATLSSLSRQGLLALSDGVCLIRASRPDGESFLLNYKAWGFIDQPRQKPRYLALYVTDPTSAIKYLGEIDQVLDPNHPNSPVRNESSKFSYKPGRKVITFKRLWQLEQPVPKGRKGGLVWPLYCSLKELSSASSLDDLLPAKQV